MGKEALPVKCKGAISRMFDGPNLAFVICVCVCVSAPLWIRIQIEVTNLNWPQNWLPLQLHLPRPCPLCCRLAKSDRKQGLATCLCTQCPYPLTSLSASPVPLSVLSFAHCLRFIYYATLVAGQFLKYTQERDTRSSKGTVAARGDQVRGSSHNIQSQRQNAYSAPSLVVALFGTSWRDEPFIFNTPSARYVIVILRANCQHNLPSPRDIRQPEDSLLTSSGPARGLKNNQQFVIFSCS